MKNESRILQRNLLCFGLHILIAVTIPFGTALADVEGISFQFSMAPISVKRIKTAKDTFAIEFLTQEKVQVTCRTKTCFDAIANLPISPYPFPVNQQNIHNMRAMISAGRTQDLLKLNPDILKDTDICKRYGCTAPPPKNPCGGNAKASACADRLFKLGILKKPSRDKARVQSNGELMIKLENGHSLMFPDIDGRGFNAQTLEALGVN